MNLPATVPTTASQMYAKNIATFFLYVLKDGRVRLDPEDEIIRETLVCHGGQVDHPKIKEGLRVLQATVGAGRALEE